MPADTASLSERGMAFTTNSRNLNTLTTMNKQPERNTAPRAACQL